MEPNSEFVTVNTKFGGTVRNEMLEGRPHLVAPIVMIVEGVLNGSDGKGFYPHEENIKPIKAWNSRPMTVGHPHKDGVGVSAADPLFLNTRKIGVVLNTKTKGRKVRTEGWFDEERTKKIDERILDALTNNKIMEVSTGFFLQKEMTKGEFKGKPYDWIARNQQPDHLAILPDEIGACSVADGAGLLQLNALHDDDEFPTIRHDLCAILNKVGMVLIGNELSYGEITGKVRSLLATTYGEKGRSWYGWIEAIYKDSVIFWDKDVLWKVGYAVSAAGEVSLSGNPAKVVMSTAYEVVKNSDPSKENEPMVTTPAVTTNSPKFDKKEHLAKLIGNNGGFEETDRVWLEKLDDAQLSKIQPKETAPANNSTPAPAPTPVPAPVVNGGRVLSAEEEEILAEAIQNRGAEKAQLVAKITANKANRFKPEYLEGRSLTELRGIAALIPEDKPVSNGSNGILLPANFAGNAGQPAGTGMGGQKLEPLPRPTMNHDKKTAKK